MSLKRLDAWREKQQKGVPPKEPWDCSKGMHKPEWSPEDGFWRCARCKLPLDSRKRDEETRSKVR